MMHDAAETVKPAAVVGVLYNGLFFCEVGALNLMQMRFNLMDGWHS